MARLVPIAVLTLLAAAACANSAPRRPLSTRDGAGGGASANANSSADANRSADANSAAATHEAANAGDVPNPSSGAGQTGSGDTGSPDDTSKPAGPQRCPADMVAVQGAYCTKLERKCLRSRKRRQCVEYEAESRCTGREVAMAFCMDRYEWPNEKGQLPKVMNTWKDARKSCASIGKRLCTENEWTLACEGPDRLGFPYGNVRDSSACPFDKPSPRVNEQRLYYSRTQAAELARLDQRDPSGSYERCVSPYGVRDMTGSVDEWVFYPPGKPYRSSLKGGNWGEYRNACRPVTRGHGENWRYYQTGFRCCKAIDGGS